MTLIEWRNKTSQDIKMLFYELNCIKKQIVNRTSQLINDGQDGEHPFITAEDIIELSVPEEVVKAMEPFTTNNRIPRVDGEGRLLKESLVTISDEGSIDIPAGQHFTVDGVPIDGLDKNFVYVRNFLGPVWNIVHGLEKYPSVSIFDGLGNKIYASVKYIDLNTVEITFNTPMTGSATLN